MTTNRDHDQEYQLTSMAVGVGSIWLAVLGVSLFAPDMVSGSEQQHLPVAAFITWIWGLLATNTMVSAWVRTRRAVAAGATGRAYLHRMFSFAVAGVWLVAGTVALFGPEMVTGTDPTRIPLCAILAPIVAAIVTRVGGELFKTVLEDEPPQYPVATTPPSVADR